MTLHLNDKTLRIYSCCTFKQAECGIFVFQTGLNVLQEYNRQRGVSQSIITTVAQLGKK